MPDTINKIYDIAIVGTGPAGLAASIYASRYRMSNAFFGEIPGGAISEAHKVCNYPGFEDISGMQLSMNFLNHAKNLGGEHIIEHVTDINKDNNLFKIQTSLNKEYFSKTVILAIGTNRNKLNVENEDYYLGKGLSYCATCDAAFYRDKVVGVIGGSSAATMAATMLADIAKKVYIIYRGTQLRGEPAWIDEVSKKENVEIVYTTVITALEGEEKLERLKLSKELNGSEYLEVDGIFVEVGSQPNVDLANKLEIELDSKGYIKVLGDQSTNIKGVWAAGDCTTASNKFRQVITAASEGSVAANAIYTYLKGEKGS
jgi:thioredoxin reductase (NADPH)